ncbi:MAG: M14 family metallopeptidase [Bacteroidota bacterium]|nr:M14 family metallopeptidase [Bacteroidota bacterium]
MKPIAEYRGDYHFRAKQKGPHVLFTAGVHGDEYEPMLAAVSLAERLKGNLIAGTVTIIPVVNPDAYKMGSRVGADGLDLARICPGKPDGSGSEKAAARVSALIRQSDYYVDMHTGGKALEIFPLAGYMLHQSADVLEKQRNMAKAFNLPVIWGTDDSLQGRTLSVARDAGVASIYVEYGGGDTVNKDIIDAYLRGCLQLLASLGMLREESPVKSNVEYWVEDFTPANGHLQSKMPAPAEGLFVPEVRLGDQVSKGQTWGFIHGLNPYTRKEVISDSKGVVLFLRKSVRVKQGDSLGGTLPVSQPGKITIT